MYYLLLIIILVIILFFIINICINNKNREYFCKYPKKNNVGEINDSKVLLDYAPQSSIFTSSCDKYWKNWPLEYNNSNIEDNAIVIKSDQLELPKEKQFANNSYSAGLVNFKELASICSDNISFNIFEKSKELLIDPTTKKELEFKYELDFAYKELNKKTWINRWEKYNPTIKITFNYDDIKSDIENINILNKNFKNRLDTKQKKLLTDKQLVLFGLLKFDIFKYKILSIQYLDNSIENPVYIIEILVYRETDLYINTFSYVGYFDNNKPIITNIEYIGRNSTDNVLLANFYNPKERNEEIINNNYSNSPVLNKDPDAVVALTKKHQEEYKLKNQYACFSLNYNPKMKNEYILPYYSRETCESNYDSYGKYKQVGIYDTPCKEDKECPFFKINKNYDNNFGKCQEDGYCELPVNMERVGYHYYTRKESEKPLCYNCNSKKFNIFTQLEDCCNEQYDEEEYPFLKSPDYAFKSDSINRINAGNPGSPTTPPRKELNF